MTSGWAAGKNQTWILLWRRRAGGPVRCSAVMGLRGACAHHVRGLMNEGVRCAWGLFAGLPAVPTALAATQLDWTEGMEVFFRTRSVSSRPLAGLNSSFGGWSSVDQNSWSKRNTQKGCV